MKCFVEKPQSKRGGKCDSTEHLSRHCPYNHANMRTQRGQPSAFWGQEGEHDHTHSYTDIVNDLWTTEDLYMVYDLSEEEPLIREATLTEQEQSRNHHSDSDEHEEVFMEPPRMAASATQHSGRATSTTIPSNPCHQAKQTFYPPLKYCPPLPSDKEIEQMVFVAKCVAKLGPSLEEKPHVLMVTAPRSTSCLSTPTMRSTSGRLQPGSNTLQSRVPSLQGGQPQKRIPAIRLNLDPLPACQAPEERDRVLSCELYRSSVPHPRRFHLGESRHRRHGFVGKQTPRVPADGYRQQ